MGSVISPVIPPWKELPSRGAPSYARVVFARGWETTILNLTGVPLISAIASNRRYPRGP
ncbi:MAG TPA: hypothetical protein VHX11_02175 [Acidobacteriaceae bacterium]|nr:hypothetical protein [Acidobacteriaceae bacterium]